jgi:hypothetical protein
MVAFVPRWMLEIIQLGLDFGLTSGTMNIENSFVEDGEWLEKRESGN